MTLRFLLRRKRYARICSLCRRPDEEIVGVQMRRQIKNTPYDPNAAMLSASSSSETSYDMLSGKDAF
eukprot:scaffold10818_cov22-Cyclotella_meneghiniana.AAC.1